MAVEYDAVGVAMTPFDRETPAVDEIGHAWSGFLTGGLLAAAEKLASAPDVKSPQASRHGRNPDRFKPQFQGNNYLPQPAQGNNWRPGVEPAMVPRGHPSSLVEVRVVSMRVAVSVLRANGQPRVIAALAAIRCVLRSSGRTAVVAAAVIALLAEPVRADTLPEALVRTYQNNPQLNAERARLRGVDEGVPQALAGYRPQLLLTLTGGLQQVRVLFFDNTIQTATLRTWTIGFTVSQTLFN